MVVCLTQVFKAEEGSSTLITLATTADLAFWRDDKSTKRTVQLCQAGD